MPNRRFDWHEHVKDVEREYRAARFAVDRLLIQARESPDTLSGHDETRAAIPDADRNLEGTYIVRLFAAFEAALRSYYMSAHKGADNIPNAATLINTTGGRRGQGISHKDRTGAHEVREVRTFWAHENEEVPKPMTIAEARSRLNTYLAWLPANWA